MTASEIAALLPDPDQLSYEQLKAEHPYNILLRYAQAIDEKYPRKLSGVVTEATDAISEGLLQYAFYILADIGSGYSYRLLELEPLSGQMYPLRVKLLEKNPHVFAEVATAGELEAALNKIFSAGFTQTLILNLLAQVDLYRESRKE